MFKTTLTAAALVLSAGLAHAAPAPLEAPAAPAHTQEIVQIEEFAYFCEWAYVYDAWGNWVTAWQCY